MRQSKILKKIRAGKVARICALGHYLPFYPKHAAAFGFDGVWVDGEHRTFDAREVQALIAFHHLADIDCIWRSGTLEKTGLYRLLEDGATALMIPHVSTAEKAKALSEAMKFPPQGDRGIDGVGLDADYWPENTSGFISHANRESFIVVQIETPLALQNLESIAAVPGVEVLFLGPGDLSLRLGCSSDAADPQMMDIQKNLARVAARHGKAWGRPVSNAAEARIVQEMGGRFLALGNEFLAIYNQLSQWAGEFDQALGESRARHDGPQKVII
jgi:4-hydroxy-2-oxoheptanedioate aldolase